MSGMHENNVLAEKTASYTSTIDPYKDAPSMHLDLPNLSRYADSVGKKIMELSEEEIKQFKI